MRWLCNRRVSVVESGDLILRSFNLEITRREVLYYIRCVWVRFTFTAASAYDYGFLNVSLEDSRGKEGHFASFLCFHRLGTRADIRKLHS